MKHYILQDGEPVPEPDLLKWARWLETADRKLAGTKVGDAEVSTVFLGLDHNFGRGEPLLFETMIFGGALDGEQERYRTREAALAGHTAWVERVEETPCPNC